MSIPKCNPNVYRKAAKLVDSGKLDFSCFAISRAVNSRGSDREWFYRDQYECMFGPHKEFELVINETTGYSYVMVIQKIKTFTLFGTKKRAKKLKNTESWRCYSWLQSVKIPN